MSESQDFLQRNRPPKVQITYELETYGAKRLVEIPFVVGVMSDLAGKSDSPEAKKALELRSFGKIDSGNFDERMSKLRPKVSFQVENTLTGEGMLPVSLEFARMEDFSPVRVAERVPGLDKLLALRQQLKSLADLIDGNLEAERLLSGLLDNNEPAMRLLTEVASKSSPTFGSQAGNTSAS